MYDVWIKQRVVHYTNSPCILLYIRHRACNMHVSRTLSDAGVN